MVVASGNNLDSLLPDLGYLSDFESAHDSNKLFSTGTILSHDPENISEDNFEDTPPAGNGAGARSKSKTSNLLRTLSDKIFGPKRATTV